MKPERVLQRQLVQLESRPPVTWRIVSNTQIVQIRLALALWKVNYKAHLPVESQDLQLNN
jgi:hypothetical protein